MTGIQTNQHFTQQNNQIFMYFRHNILLHATAHIVSSTRRARALFTHISFIDEFIPKPFLTSQIILYILVNHGTTN